MYSQANDTGLLKEAFGMHLSSGTGRWAPRTAHFELFVVDDGRAAALAPGSGAYRGLYMAQEHVDRVRVPCVCVCAWHAFFTMMQDQRLRRTCFYGARVPSARIHTHTHKTRAPPLRASCA